MIYSFDSKPTSTETILVGPEETELVIEYRKWHHYGWQAKQKGAHPMTRSLAPTRDEAIGQWIRNQYSIEG